MKTTLLSHSDLADLVGRIGLDRLMDELIERLASAFVDYDPRATEVPARDGFHYQEPEPGLIEWMPLMKRGEMMLMKVVGYHPHSPLPTILSTFGLFDTATGAMIALADGTLMTALRTGAASAVASRWLARPESRTIGLIGCGAQAVTQLHAIGRVFDFAEVLTHDIDAAALASFPERVAPFLSEGTDVVATPVDDLVATCDILCTATSVEVGAGPVFDGSRTRDWLHVNSIGADVPGKVEVPLSLLRRSFVCPDFPLQARVEGECQQLLPEDIGPEICEIARCPSAFVEWQSKRSVFDSTGFALEDYIVLELMLEHAREYSVGTEMEISGVGEDPRDPYESLSKATNKTHFASGDPIAGVRLSRE
jgi:ornithine cyclodeaminase/alanine dehydrogenase-like protein (mu-crystallin family)